MNRLLLATTAVLAILMIVLTFPDGNAAVAIALFMGWLTIWFIRKYAGVDANIVSNIFILAVLSRLAFGLFIEAMDLRSFFGGDANLYDRYGVFAIQTWFGDNTTIITDADFASRYSSIGWGMIYFVGSIYTITGKNIYAAQTVVAMVGAAISPVLYFCSIEIIRNRRVALISAIISALLPAFVIWTGQLLKDGLIVFAIILSILMVLKLQRKMKYLQVAVLIGALAAVASLRFYIFFMLIAAVFGAFVIGRGSTKSSIARRFIIVALLGLGLTYVGILRYSSIEFSKFASLEVVQNTRQDLANRANTGFGSDIDVTTTEGAITAIPVGLTYLYLAPFPWTMTNLRQAITLPDVILWYLCLPFLIMGMLFVGRNKFREALPVFVFAVFLSIAFALFQGNVGTAYRQRSQIQVFLFIFIATGITLTLEKRENRRIASGKKVSRNRKQLVSR